MKIPIQRELLTECVCLRQLYALSRRFARDDVPVLLRGAERRRNPEAIIAEGKHLLGRSHETKNTYSPE